MAADCHLVVSMALSACALVVAMSIGHTAGQTTDSPDDGTSYMSFSDVSPSMATSTSTRSPPPRSTTEKHKVAGFKLTTEMVVGLAMGFGGFSVFLITMCCCWYFCCKMFKDRKDRMAPGDFRAKPTSTSNQALTSPSSIEA